MEIKKGKRYQVVLREYSRGINKAIYGKAFSKVVSWKAAEKVKRIIEGINKLLGKGSSHAGK